MAKHTELEKKIFNAALDFCFDNCEADVNDLSSITGLNKDTVKGVVGSLTKKGLVGVGKEKRGGKVYLSINPYVGEGREDIVSYGCDEYTADELEALKI
tara:strand:+ start:88 stop:384 length:297 start_codon:yes stop_codon:yes gene_type:complete